MGNGQNLSQEKEQNTLEYPTREEYERLLKAHAKGPRVFRAELEKIWKERESGRNK